MEKLVDLARHLGVLRLFPKRVRLWARARVGFEDLHRARWRHEYDELIRTRGLQAPRAAVTDREVCIVHDWMLRHVHYEIACRELGVPYHVMDLTTADWLEKLTPDRSAIYFIRPFVLSTIGRGIYEDRAYILSHVMKRTVFPDFGALWIYESKRRTAALLASRGVASPRTWVFYSRNEAEAFAEAADYPVVFKTDLGSDAIGVRIVRSRREAQRIITLCFTRGFSANAYDPRDRNYRQALFQEYLGDVSEWRVVRIGDSYFAYEKLKSGDFHSGSKKGAFRSPALQLLDFCRQSFDAIGLNCGAMDIFETNAGAYLVNEVQTYYGANAPSAIYYVDGMRFYLPDEQDTEMMINGCSGRYYRGGGQWVFEGGDFSRNAGCNLRVKLAFQQIGEPLPGYLA